MYIIITLLAGCQNSILSSNEWHNDTNPAFKHRHGPKLQNRRNDLGYEKDHPHYMTNLPQQVMLNWPGFLNSTRRLNPRKRTVRLPVGIETT